MKIENTTPLVSIIMAVKDTEPYLPDCLDSILGQSYLNWELIAVNDHSTDKSLHILNEYALKDSRIRVFNSEGQKLIPALQIHDKAELQENLGNSSTIDYRTGFWLQSGNSQPDDS